MTDTPNPVTLDELLTLASTPTGNGMADALAALEDGMLLTIEADTLAAFDNLRSRDSHTDADVEAMTNLRNVLAETRSVAAGRREAADARAERIRALTEEMAPVAETPADADTDTDGGTEAPAEQPETPEAPTAADTIPAAAPAAMPVPVAASLRPSLAALPNARPTAPNTRVSLTAAAELPGFNAGSDLADLNAITAAAMARFGAYGRMAGSKGRTTAGIAQIHRNRGEGHTFDDRFTVEDLDRVTNPRHISAGMRAPGQALVASGGWCAPSEIDYSLCDPATTDGILDIPKITLTRGGIRWPETPDFASIYAACGFDLTEAQVESGTPKPCCEVPCPDFDELRLDAVGVCVTTPILTQRAYPELVKYFIAQSLAAHAHKINAKILNKMWSLSEAVTYAQAGTSPDFTQDWGPGATAGILAVLELAAMEIRTRHRLARDATLELVLPDWVQGVVRSDISKRITGTDYMAVTDAQMSAWFAARDLAVQFVYDFADSFNDVTNTSPKTNGFGGTTPSKDWPATVPALIYPAGTFVVGTNDVISLDSIYDSVNLPKNMSTALFTEEGIGVGKKCWTSRAILLPVCADGITGGVSTPTYKQVCPTA